MSVVRIELGDVNSSDPCLIPISLAQNLKDHGASLRGREKTVLQGVETMPDLVGHRAQGRGLGQQPADHSCPQSLLVESGRESKQEREREREYACPSLGA